MLDHITIVALGVVAGAALAGAVAEYTVRRFGALSTLRHVAFALCLSIGLYAAALTLQRGRVNPATHQAFVALLLVLATIVAARLCGLLIARHTGRAAGTIGSITLFVSVGETLVAIVGGLVVLGYLGISVAPILTAFGIGGLAVALALQDTLANFFSGIQIAASRQVHAGDFVRLDADNAGTVIDINWRNTVIRDPDGNRIIVPNQKLAQAIFTAYRLPLQVPVTVTLDRGADLGRITEVARETAKRIVRAAPESEIYVRFKKIAEGSVDMVVTLPAKDPAERRRLGSEFAKAFLQRVGAEDLKSEQVKAVAT